MRQPRESKFQREVIDDLYKMFPDAIIQKGNSAYHQGIPDILILWRDKWGALECKRSEKADRRVNQEYYVDLMNDMSFAAFIYPANKKQVLNDLQRAFRSHRRARVPGTKPLSLDQLRS